MNRTARIITILIFLIALRGEINAQIDDFCAEAGYLPSLDSPFARVPYIFGRITVKGLPTDAKSPDVVVIIADSQQNVNRMNVGSSGTYCFKLRSSGTIVVEVNGIEAVRKPLPPLGPTQQREDFEINVAQLNKSAPPGVISAKFYYPANEKTKEIYRKVVEAEAAGDSQKTIGYLKEIVAVDPKDFIAWAKLGALYFSQESFTEADAAFRKCLELRVEYTPAWINVGKMRAFQKQYRAAIEIFKHAITLEPNYARIYQLLGEVYLQDKQGTLGAEALNKAIELDPIGMAECHLRLAHLYQLAKANKLATREYKAFLTKVPDYKEKKKLEDFIRKNPE